uniref:Uncharacterized protein n=1 Tax=Octopus bimaculoides TaxID=37653 RepID=A0A0L8HAH2_OCTBM
MEEIKIRLHRHSNMLELEHETWTTLRLIRKCHQTVKTRHKELLSHEITRQSTILSVPTLYKSR